MFKEIKESFMRSDKSKESIFVYQRETLEAICELEDLKDYLKDSIAERVLLNESGIYIQMNEMYGNTLLKFHKNDYTAASNHILTFGEYERDEIEMVLRIMDIIQRNNMVTVLDVGANVGWYSTVLGNKYKNSKIYSFEPSPKTFKRLCDNLQANGLAISRAYNIGLYTENSTLSFYFDEKQSGASSLRNLKRTDAVREIKVDVKKMDDWILDKDVSSVDFIKCDVEGSELFVYKGGENTIKKYKPIIFSEMLRKWSAKFGYHPNDIIEYLANMGYQCYVVRDKKLKLFGVVDDETVETNYFFIHPDKNYDVIQELS